MSTLQKTISPMIRNSRTDFVKGALLESDANNDPLVQFNLWLEQAMLMNEMANAMVLSTVGPKGIPDSRVLLLRDASLGGFTFYTNYKSKKASDLAKNPNACMLFFWPDLERQVRITGVIKKLSRKNAEQYFASRPFESQVGAHVSIQSSVTGSRNEMDEKFDILKKQYEGKKVPMPAYWGGFVLMPQSFEFWQGRANRLHDRLRYTREKRKWQIRRLMP